MAAYDRCTMYVCLMQATLKAGHTLHKASVGNVLGTRTAVGDDAQRGFSCVGLVMPVAVDSLNVDAAEIVFLPQVHLSSH